MRVHRRQHSPAVDDFGTGYSSLAYLQQLPVHELKVDKSFVVDVGSDGSSRAIVQSVVDLGHSLGLLVVAEGVEDEAAWDQLVRLGCDRAQGYLLSRPVAGDDLIRWLRRVHAGSIAGQAPASRGAQMVSFAQSTYGRAVEESPAPVRATIPPTSSNDRGSA